MTIVTKNINGRTYYYFEEWKDGKSVTTYIGSGTNSEFDVTANPEALVKHFENLYKSGGIFSDDSYHFEKYPAIPLTLTTLKLAKSLYQMLRKSLSISEIETELFIRYVHATTAIEGCTLDLAETKNILSESELTPDNKPFRDSQAVINYKNVKRYIDNYHGHINEKFVLQLHKLIMNNLDEGPTGQYRKTSRGILGVNHPEWKEIPTHMDDLFVWYNEKQQDALHPIELACIFHCRFEQIHPFHDGNGRVGRAILDLMLRKNGFATIFIPIEQKHDYISALRVANTKPGKDGNYSPIIEFMIDRMMQTLLHIFVKSGIVQTFKSLEFKEFALQLIPETIYEDFINILQDYEKSNDLRC